MKKRAVMIMMTVILSFTSVMSPVCLAAASEGTTQEETGSEIREALEQMDEMGISPAAVAEKFFGIRPAEPSSGKKPGNTLIEDAERTVRKSTEGFFTVLWEGFLDTLGNMITTGISVFGSQEGHSAKGGSSR